MMKLRNKKTGGIGICDLRIVHSSDAPLVYHSLAEINEDWEDDKPLIIDEKTKEAFIEYLDKHKDERFFQAIRNFAKEYLGDDFSFIYACNRPIDSFDRYHDTFFMFCDELHEMRKDTE